MGYSVSLISSASQNEGNSVPTQASFVFNLTRAAGDTSDGDAVSFKILNADFSPSDDFTVAGGTGTVPTWGGGTSTTLTLTANGDLTIEPNETFQVWIYRNADAGHPFYQGSITLLNDDTGPVFSTPAAVSAAENQQAVETAVASGAGVTYAITGGADASAFGITAGGILTFNSAPNFESPTDTNRDNIYNVQVTATSAGQTSAQDLAVTVTNVNEAVSIVGGATAAVSLAENKQAVLTAASTDIDTGDTATWSLAGGLDASKFAINASTGALSFITAPDFEVPTDSDGNNSYIVNIRATDAGGLFATQQVTVSITDAPAVISSNGGVDTALIHIPENTSTTTAVTTLVAADGDGSALVYSKSGVDAALFTLDPVTHALTFTASPNFEAPADADGDNLYKVTLTATSSGGADSQQLLILVDNVYEPDVPGDQPPPPGGGATQFPVYFTGTDASESLIASANNNDTIDGGLGTDSIDGGSGANSLQGGDGNDFIRGLDGTDTVDGGTGNDDVNGNTGNDMVLGGDGADTVRGGQGDDTVSGGEGDDPHVNGNLGNDIVHGDNGNDTVYGGQGSDTIYGDAGADSLSGDLGNDVLFGGAGADRFGIARGGGQDWVGDFNAAEGDHVVLAVGTTYTVSNFSGQVLITLSSGDTIGLAGVAFSSFSTDWIAFA